MHAYASLCTLNAYVTDKSRPKINWNKIFKCDSQHMCPTSFAVRKKKPTKQFPWINLRIFFLFGCNQCGSGFHICAWLMRVDGLKGIPSDDATLDSVLFFQFYFWYDLKTKIFSKKKKNQKLVHEVATGAERNLSHWNADRNDEIEIFFYLKKKNSERAREREKKSA